MPRYRAMERNEVTLYAIECDGHHTGGGGTKPLPQQAYEQVGFLACNYVEFGLNQIRGIAADHDCEGAGFDDAVHVAIQE